MLDSSERLARVAFRAAKPLRVYAILALVVAFMMYFAPVLSGLAALFVLLIVALMIVCTLFLILLNDGFRDFMSDTTNFTNNLLDLSTKIPDYAIFACVIAAVFSVLAIIAVFPDRANIGWKRGLVSGCVLLGLCVMLGALCLGMPLN